MRRLLALAASLITVTTLAATPAHADPTAPGAPQSVITTPGDATIAVSWAAPDNDGGSAITSYSVTATTAGGPSATCAPLSLDDLQCTITGLTNGTDYTIAVVATNDQGSGDPAEAHDTPYTTPGQPTGVAAHFQANSTSAAISWHAPYDGGTAITAYVATASPGGRHCSTGEASCTIVGLAFGTRYTFTVVAMNTAGSGPASSESAGVTPRIGTHSAIIAAARTARYPNAITVTGSVRRADNRAAAGQRVTLQYRIHGSSTSFRNWGVRTVTQLGTVSFAGVRLARTTELRLHTVTGGPYLGATSVRRVVVVSPRLSLQAAPARATVGRTIKVSGQMTPNVAGRIVSIEGYGGGAWHRLGSTRVQAGGRYAFTIRRALSGRYWLRVRLVASASLGASLSRSLPITFVVARSRTSIGMSSTAIRVGNSVRIAGRVSPAARGHRVFLRRWTGRSWQTVATQRLGAGSGYAFVVRPPRAGRYAFRVYDPALLRRVAASVSRTVRLTVHRAPKPKPTPQPEPQPVQQCTPGYSPCIAPGPDVDCAGGSGNGPRYIEGPVEVTGNDPYDLDSNHDGVGCES